MAQQRNIGSWPHYFPGFETRDSLRREVADSRPTPKLEDQISVFMTRVDMGSLVVSPGNG